MFARYPTLRVLKGGIPRSSPTWDFSLTAHVPLVHRVHRGWPVLSRSEEWGSWGGRGHSSPPHEAKGGNHGPRLHRRLIEGHDFSRAELARVARTILSAKCKQQNQTKLARVGGVLFMERRASPPVHPRAGHGESGRYPSIKANVLLKDLPVVLSAAGSRAKRMTRRSRRACPDRSGRNPYPIHRATSTARRSLSPGNASIVKATSQKREVAHPQLFRFNV
jgi:hypothetical protein